MVNTTTLLFVPVSRKAAFRRLDRGRWSEVKSRVVRNAQIYTSAATGLLNFTDYHHAIRTGVNRGDIAIGLAVARQLEKVSSGLQLSDLGWDDFPQGELYSHIKGHSRVVIGGGGYIFLNSAGGLNTRRLDIEAFERFDGEVFAHGIGLNRLLFEDPWLDFGKLPSETKSWVRRFSDRCKRISVRDQATADLFSIVAGREVAVVGDPALSLGNAAQIDFSRESNIVGINTASHGSRALTCLQKLMPHFERLYKHIQKTGCELRYFVHDDADYSVIRYLRLRGHSFEVVDGSPDQLIESYSKCMCVVNQMLHSSILAFSAGTPCIAAAYDTKSFSFYDQFGLSDYCMGWEKLTFDGLREKYDTLLSKKAMVVSLISEKAVELVRAQEDFLKDVVRGNG